MQRIMGAILIIFASGGIGVTKGIELQKYLRELEQLKQLFWMLKREIQYTKAPFSEAFSHIGRRMEGAALFGETDRGKSRSYLLSVVDRVY